MTLLGLIVGLIAPKYVFNLTLYNKKSYKNITHHFALPWWLYIGFCPVYECIPISSMSKRR